MLEWRGVEEMQFTVETSQRRNPRWKMSRDAEGQSISHRPQEDGSCHFKSNSVIGDPAGPT